MYRLIKHFEGINDYGVSEKHLITAGKQPVFFYNQNDFTLIGSLTYQRFPKILRVEDDVLLQDQTRIVNIDYSLTQKASYPIALEEIRLLDVIDDHLAIVKQGSVAPGTHRMAMYALREARMIWDAVCSDYVHRFFNTKYILVDSDESKSLVSLDFKTGKEKWTTNVDTIFTNFYGADGEYTIMEHPRVWSETVVIQIQQLNSGKRFVAGLDASSGQLKWQHAGLSNIELFEDQILALNYDGILTKLNADTGAIFNTTDLSTSFREQEMHCEHRFLATKSHLYFKHGITGKVGILNLTDMQLDVIQLPPGNTMATSEVPVPIDNRLYVRSAPQNNLFVYESLSHN